MIALNDLLNTKQLPGNYYASGTYIQGDLEHGLLESRRGDRLLALPHALIQGIYAGLDEEVGQAAHLVLFKCGHWWGKSFYARFYEELQEYHGQSLPDMEMIEFLQNIQQYWRTSGWGTFELDLSYYSQGFLVIETRNSPFAMEAPQSDKPVCSLEQGIFSAFFSQLTGHELYCIQTTCESLSAECNRFILGLPNRLKPIEVCIEEGHSHEMIMTRLCDPQSAD